MMELPNIEMTSTYYYNETTFPGHHCHHLYEAVQAATDQADEQDLFDTIALVLAMDSLALNKPFDHHRFIQEIICGIYRHHHLRSSLY